MVAPIPLLLLWTASVTVVDGYTYLSDQTLSRLAQVEEGLDAFNGSILAPILQPRVPGTRGSAAVRAHFNSWFATQLPSWTVTMQTSTATLAAPILDPTRAVYVPIINIVATRDPPAIDAETTQSQQPQPQPQPLSRHRHRRRRLVLAAHYDSKYGQPPDGHTHHQNLTDGFLGAVDSAVPCALMLHAARAVDAALTRRWEGLREAGLSLAAEPGLQILLLDGEEAFGLWTGGEGGDSLHGSRALARDWEQRRGVVDGGGGDGDGDGDLDRMDLLVLLDLLGAPRPSVPSFFRDTHWAYQKAADVEARARRAGLLESGPGPSFFPDAGRHVDDGAVWEGGELEDDHLPFLERGVRVLHWISAPYPDVWHTMEDDAAHLDPAVVRDWARILTGFTADWMGLEGYVEES
ncbi:glutaminyl-peptide cyclotransferase [Apiospora sp. TS-2023a]